MALGESPHSAIALVESVVSGFGKTTYGVIVCFGSMVATTVSAPETFRSAIQPPRKSGI
ncbi:MAG: hypothetical protein ABJZ55_09815 [Fuerstiella sp.]